MQNSAQLRNKKNKNNSTSKFDGLLKWHDPRIITTLFTFDTFIRMNLCEEKKSFLMENL
jgi:hypothetical protein